MKSFKKILAMMLAVLMLAVSCFMSVSAEEFTPSEEPVIYFEVPEDWNNFKTVYCHIWEYEGDSLASWQSKKERCTLVEGNLYSYDISKAGTLAEGKIYGIIFSLDTDLRTYDAIFSTECLGDTFYCDDTIYENPLDSSKTCRAAFWKNQDRSVYGPLLQVTSIGNVIGTALPPGQTAEGVFKSFLINDLENARNYSGKTDQAIIDDAVKALNLTEADVDRLITGVVNSSNSITWTLCWNGKVYNSAAVLDSTTDFIGGDANMDSKINVKDATYIQKAVADLVVPRKIQKLAADVDTNNSLNIKDATAIQKACAGIVSGSYIIGMFCRLDPDTGTIHVEVPPDVAVHC